MVRGKREQKRGLASATVLSGSTDRLLLPVEFPYKSALVQLCDKARTNELFGLVAPDLGVPGRDDLVDGVQVFGDRIRRGNEILLVNFSVTRDVEVI